MSKLKKSAKIFLLLIAVSAGTFFAVRIYDSRQMPPLDSWHTHVPAEMSVKAMDAGDYCIDVPDSPLYNRIVDTKDVGAEAVKGSTEPMRRDIHLDGDDVYRLGFVIEHNAGGRANAGSCIFAHLWRGTSRPTAGCNACA